MYSAIKHSIKQAFRLLGFDLQRYIPKPRHSLPVLLDLYQVDAIFDIGANIGMSGEFFRSIGFKQKIVSFEPVSHLYCKLEKRTMDDPLWFCENVALGDAFGELMINVSGSTGVSSSILDMTEITKNNAPDQRVTSQEKIKVKTLDLVINDYYPKGNRLFIKIDVQGYEKNVLDGAMASLDRIIGMRVEMSIVNNYEGECLFHEMLPYLYSLGYKLVGIEIAWSNLSTQEIYQVDSILFRTDRLPPIT